MTATRCRSPSGSVRSSDVASPVMPTEDVQRHHVERVERQDPRGGRCDDASHPLLPSPSRWRDVWSGGVVRHASSVCMSRATSTYGSRTPARGPVLLQMTGRAHAAVHEDARRWWASELARRSLLSTPPPGAVEAEGRDGACSLFGRRRGGTIRIVMARATYKIGDVPFEVSEPTSGADPLDATLLISPRGPAAAPSAHGSRSRRATSLVPPRARTCEREER